jgi:WD40 repeat protein
MRILGEECERLGWGSAIRWYRDAARRGDEFSATRFRKLAGVSERFRLTRTFETGYEHAPLSSIAFSGDGKWAVLCSPIGEEAPSLWDAVQWTQVRRISFRKHIETAALNRSGEVIAGCFGDLAIFHAGDDTLLSQFEMRDVKCLRIWFLEDELMAVASGSNWSGMVAKAERGSGDLVSLYSGLRILDVTRDASLVAQFTDDDQRIEIRHVAANSLRTTLEAPVLYRETIQFARQGAFSPDGTRFAAKDREAVRIWDTTSGQELVLIPDARNASFGPDGKLLATYQGDTLLRLWDAETGELQQTIGDEGFVRQFAFRPDGKLLVTQHGSTMCVWEAV